MESLLADLRYSLRMLVKRPAFTLVAVLSLMIETYNKGVAALPLEGPAEGGRQISPRPLARRLLGWFGVGVLKIGR